MKLPDPYRWLEWPLQTWLDWSRADRIGLGYVTMQTDRQPGCRTKPAISMPEPVFLVENALCQLPDKWRKIVIAEWLYRWPHGYAAKRFRMSRPTHLGIRKHAYGFIAEKLMVCLDDEDTASSIKAFTQDTKYSIAFRQPNNGAPHA